ncbi:MAG: response regulator transcription factor [Flavobacteriaceae bacterium]
MSTTISILLAEDEPSLGQIIKESLETRNFRVFLASNGEEALKLYQNEVVEVLVLDVMMPKKDGLTLAKEVRQDNADIPILFLTAKSQTKDVLEGFQVGGNDYLKKPFSMEELIVRIHNLLRRSSSQKSMTIQSIGEYQFDVQKQTLQFKTEDVMSLTHREAQLLDHLLQHKNTVLDRSFVLKTLWGNDDFFNARSMDVFITKLRKKLKLDTSIQIVNIRGYGYKLICD